MHDVINANPKDRAGFAVRRNRLSTASFILVAAVIIYYGCEGGGSSVPGPRISSGPTSQPSSASLIVTLAASTSLPIPGVGGFSGSFTEANSVAAGTMVTLTTYLKAPAGAPAPLAIVRAPLQSAMKGKLLTTSPRFRW